MTAPSCPRCRATFGCMCVGPQTATTNSTFLEAGAEILRLRAALDEANTDRQRLAEQLALRDQACVLGGQEVIYERTRADRAVAQVQRARDLGEFWATSADYEPSIAGQELLRALAGEGSEHGS